MARFTPQKFDWNDINGGERFQNGQEPQEDAFNAPIEGSAYAIEKAEDAIEKAEDAIAKADQALNSIIPSGGTYPPLTAYPIGSVYISVNSTSPASLFGGTWTRIEDTFLLAAGSSYEAGSTGGEATHTLTIDEMPAHSHGFQQHDYSGTHSSYAPTNVEFVNIAYLNTTSEGGSKPHNNMPPYLTVNIWRRVS